MTNGKLPAMLVMSLIEGNLNKHINMYTVHALMAFQAMKDGDLKRFELELDQSSESINAARHCIGEYAELIGIDGKKLIDYSLLKVDKPEDN